VLVAWNVASCNFAAKNAAAPVPEAEQVVSGARKDFYMVASAVAPQSPAQQEVILRMVEKASNEEELLPGWGGRESECSLAGLDRRNNTGIARCAPQ